jgi:L-asparaginases, type I
MATAGNRSSILLVYTGGTIGMRQDSSSMTLKPFDFSQILEEVPELNKFALKIDSYTFDPLIDSSDVEPSLWKQICMVIKKNYDKYDGFVVLHGTDTMAYTASVMSFLMENLAKPVVLTGSQLPIGAPRTDGKENLISAVEIASAKDSSGHPMVPEVCIYFNSMLLRGNRCTKVSSEDFTAFRSPNYPVLAEAGISIRYNEDLIRKPESWDEPLSVNLNLDTRISILKVHPGITPQVMKYFMCGNETRAIILETYGSGNAPSKEWFLEIIRQASAMGKILLNVTQCLSGTVDMSIYATGKALEEAGVVSGRDMTTEGALAKLFHLMGKSEDNEWVKARLGENLRGEISL